MIHPLRLTAAGAFHSCKEMRELGPLGWSDGLAQVDDRVHGYVGVGLHQATTQVEHNNMSLPPLNHAATEDNVQVAILI